MPRRPLRNCPVCGVTMVASKSDERLLHDDIFTCLRCETVVDFSGRHRESSSRIDKSDRSERKT